MPPPRKDRQKQDKQNRKQKKRTHAEASASLSLTASARSGGTASGSADQDEDDAAIEDEEEEEADDEKDGANRRPVKKLKRHVSAPSSRTVSAHSSPQSRPASGPSRLILRLPNNAGFNGDASQKCKKSKLSSPSARFPRTVTSSPVSSPELAMADLDDEGGRNAASTMAAAGFQLTYASESSDDFSELDEDDEDVRGSEEAYLIADKLKKLDRKLRKGSQSPDLTHSQGSDHDERLEVVQPGSRGDLVSGRESIMFEIARLRRDSDSHRPTAKRSSDAPVTWSGAEDEDDLDNLDTLLGLTASESAALIGNSARALENEGRTMRFEDFMAADDGDESDSSSGESEHSAEGLWSSAHPAEGLDTDADNEHIETTQEVVQNGGFVFYTGPFSDYSYHDRLNGTLIWASVAGPGDTSDDEVSEDCVSVTYGDDNDGGETTDTLDDTDHLGLVRFGIEAVDEDDEEAEEALQHAMLDRHMSDARNMGLSVSMQALAEQPELVIAKTAKTLGVSVATAAKILTSVGMSLLVENGNASDAERSEAEATSSRASHQNASSRRSIGATGECSISGQPILGSFEPNGVADLCVVVGQSELPAPSPFSARKRRRPRAIVSDSSTGHLIRSD